jgi:phosphoribosylamine---glycine ligase
MKILILGGGGREHALAWKIAQSPLCEKLFCAPGNPGIAASAECIELELKPPFAALVEWCRERSVDLVVVGPEDPLAAGVVDALADAGIKAFGPTAAGARIEASKTFAKEIMRAANIPTGEARSFTESASALEFLKSLRPPYVIKADGLAAGKGVTVATDLGEAEAAVREALDERRFGAAGSEILIEEFLEGVEASLLAFTDGQTVLPMESAQDHKAVYDGDRGPNTGGMGALSPAPVLTPAFRKQAVEQILKPAVEELARRGIAYRGVLYAGLMVTASGPKVIEFNCRFGDPEVQALVPRMADDLVPVLLACAEGRLAEVTLAWKSEACVCIVAASGGYPGDYAKGIPIEGLPGDRVSAADGSVVFHAGTKLDAQGRVVTAGGRVLGVTALGGDLNAARERAYATLRGIRFEGMHYRTDIGFRAAGRPKL